jgi:hypothetical protein
MYRKRHCVWQDPVFDHIVFDSHALVSGIVSIRDGRAWELDVAANTCAATLSRRPPDFDLGRSAFLPHLLL